MELKNWNFTETNWNENYKPAIHDLNMDIYWEIPWESVEAFNPPISIKSKVDEIFLLNNFETSDQIIPEIFKMYPKLAIHLTTFSDIEFKELRKYLIELKYWFNLEDIQSKTLVRAYNWAIILNLIVHELENSKLDKVKIRKLFLEWIDNESNRRNSLSLLHESILQSKR